MTPRLLIDENIGRPLTHKLAALLVLHHSRPLIEHIIDFMGHAGAKDEDWIPAAAKDGWTIITGDSGKRCGGAKLPDLCARHGIRHVLLSGKLCQEKQFEKARAIIVVWPHLLEAIDHTGPGARIKLNLGSVHPMLDWSPR